MLACDSRVASTGRYFFVGWRAAYGLYVDSCVGSIDATRLNRLRRWPQMVRSSYQSMRPGPASELL